MLNLIKLENRIVLDGAAVGEAVDHALDAHESMISGETFVPSEISGNTDHLAGAAALLASDPADTAPQAEPVEIILVADSLPDYQTLVNAANPGTHVIVYDADEASAAEVMKQVAERSQELDQPVGSLSVLSHGGEGSFRLGNEMITEYNVDENADAWESLKSVLAEDSQIYVFGCNTAGDSGQALLDSLARATGADVFASDDSTGAEGDWDLEAASQDADDAETPPLDTEKLSDYEGTLLTKAIPTSIETIEDEPGGFDIYLYGSDVDAGTPHDLEHAYDTVDPDAPLQNLNVYYEGWITDRPKEINGQMVEEYHKWSVEYEPVLNDSGEVTLDFTLNGEAYQTQVVIRPINDPPSIDPQQFVIEENSPSGMFVGTVVADDVGGPNPAIEGTTLKYRVVSGSGRDLFDVDPDTGQITVAEGADLDYEAKSEYILDVQVQDNGEGKLTNQAPVTILLTNQNEEPDIDPQNFAVMENSPGGTAVGDIIATDPDGDNLTYTVIGGDGMGLFDVDPDTGALTVADGADLDYETKNLYQLDVQVQDDGDGNLTDHAIMTIRVLDQNIKPEIDPQTFYVDENSPAGTDLGDIEASDPDGDTLTYTVIGGTGDGVFNVDPVTGELTVAEGADLNREVTPQYTLEVQVQDDGDENLTEQATMTIIVRDQNDPPDIDPQSFNVMENSPAGTDVGDIKATDEDQDPLTFSVIGGDGMGVFDVDPTNGQLTVAEGANLDYETKNLYQLDVQVEDEEGLTDHAIMTIHVLDENDPPQIAPQTFDVDENSPAATPVNPGPVVATDPDEDNLVYRVIGGSGEGIFNIHPGTGQILVADGADLDHERTPSYTLEVQVEDDGDGHLTNQATMTININDLNEPPDIEPQQFQVQENSPSGTDVGTVVATDPDEDDITFEVVGGTGEGLFILDPNTGELTVAPGADLDYDTTPEYTLDVKVTDEEGLTDQAVITITLIDKTAYPYGVTKEVTYIENSAPVPLAENVQVKGDAEEAARTMIEWEEYRILITDEQTQDDILATYEADENAAIPIADVEIREDADLIRKDDVLTVDTTGTNITATYDPATGILRMQGPDTIENFVKVESTITFSCGDDNENPNYDGSRTFVVVSAGEPDVIGEAGKLNVIAVNDAPEISLPEPQTTGVDEPIVFSNANGNLVSISDPDSHHYERETGWSHDDIKVTFSSDQGGTLTLITGQRQDGAVVENNGTDNLVIIGTLDEINDVLKEVTYAPPPGFEGTENLSIIVNDQGAHGTPGYDDPMIDIDTVSITIGNPHPYKPDLQPEPETPDEGGVFVSDLSSQRGVALGFLYPPGEVLDTGRLHEFGRMATRGTAGDEELYLCCTLEEALRIGCRFAPAVDSEARFSHITWEWMSGELGWEPPLLDEEFDLYSSNPTQRHFLREEGDVGLNGKAGELAWSFFGDTKDEPFDHLFNKHEKYFVRGSDGEFNAAPGELKQAFFAGREHLDTPAGSWGSTAWPYLRGGEPVSCDEDAVQGAAPRSGEDAEFDEELPVDEKDMDFENIPEEEIKRS